MRRLRRWIGYVLLLLLVLLLAALWLLGTTSGARTAAWAAQRFEPRLSLEVVDGSLLGGIEAENIRWSDPATGIEASVARLESDWDWSCFPYNRLCLGEWRIDEVRVDVPAPAGSAAEPGREQSPAEPAGEWTPPVEVTLPSLSINDLKVRVGDYRVAWQRFATGLQLTRADGLVIERFDLRGLYVSVPTTEAQETPERSQPLSLPTVRTPLPVTVKSLVLTDTRLDIGGQAQFLPYAALAGQWRGSRLRLDQLTVDHALAEARASGSLNLRDDYPLDITLRGRLGDIPQLRGEQIQARLAGSLADLRLDVTARGPVNAEAKGSLQPLHPDMPFDLRLTAERLIWPLGAAKPAYDLSGLDASVQGSLDDYRFQLMADFAWAERDLAGNLRASGQGSTRAVQLDEAVVNALDGRIEAKGVLAFQPALRWDLEVKLAQIQTDKLLPAYPGVVSGDLRTRGRLAEEGLVFAADPMNLTGRLAGYQFSLDGAVESSRPGAYRLRPTTLSMGDNRVSAQGSLEGDQLALEADLNLPKLHQLYPELAGQLTGTLSVGSTLTSPRISVDLSGEQLRGFGVETRDLTLAGEIAPLGESPGADMTLSVGGIITNRYNWERLRLSFDGDLDSHQVRLGLEGGPAGGEVSLRGGMTAARGWDGELEVADLRTPMGPLVLQQAVQISVMPSPWRVRLTDHCWRSEEARLCLSPDGTLGQSGSLAVEVSDFQLARLQAWMPARVDWRGKVGATAEAQWRAGGRPTGQLALRFDAGRWTVRQDEGLELELDYQSMVLNADLGSDVLALSLELESDDLGRGNLAVQTNPYATERTLSGEVDLTGLNIGVAAPFAPELKRLQGLFSAKGRLSGPLTRPAFDGRLRLEDGAVSLLAMPIDIRDIQITGDVSGTTASLDGQFRMADGKGSVAGEVGWGERLYAELDFQGERLPVDYEPYVHLRVSPDLKLSLTPQRARIQGEIRVPEGDITVESLPEGAVSVSNDVVVVDAGEREPEAAFDVAAQVRVVLGEKVKFDAFGLTGRLEGALRVNQVGGSVPEGNGDIRILEGEYRGLGQRLKIQRGIIIFAGPLDQPLIDVEAVREVQGVVAGIRLRGPADDPRVSFFSNPSMPEQDIVYVILRGRLPGEGGGQGLGTEVLMTQLLLAGGVTGSKGVLAELGLENVTIDTEGAGEGTQFTVSGYLSPELYLKYGYGVFDQVAEITLRYELLPRLYLQAVSSVDSAVDLIYTFAY